MHDTRVPSDGDRQAFPESEAAHGLDAHAVRLDRNGRLFGRPVGTAERGGAHAGDALGQPHVRGCRLDRHVPFVAGHIPVQLVVLFEEPQPIGHAVPEPDGPRGVHGARHPDLQLAIVAFTAALDPQRAALRVDRRYVVEAQRVVQPLRRAVLDGDRAEDAVPGSREPRHDRFLDENRSIGRDVDGCIEAPDFERALSVGGRGEQHGQRQPEQPRCRATTRQQHQNFTLGTSRSASGISKNSRFLKPNMPATRFDGNCCTLVLRSRTTAL